MLTTCDHYHRTAQIHAIGREYFSAFQQRPVATWIVINEAFDRDTLTSGFTRDINTHFVGAEDINTFLEPLLEQRFARIQSSAKLVAIQQVQHMRIIPQATEHLQVLVISHPDRFVSQSKRQITQCYRDDCSFWKNQGIKHTLL
ncbi:hypothetical protein D3C75_881390 [compost metagenome]